MSCVESKRKLSSGEMDMLRSLIGSTIQSIEGCIVSYPNAAWSTVRIHAESESIDAINRQEPMTMDEFGNQDEFGTLHVCSAPQEALEMLEASSEATSFSLNKEIRSMTLFNERIDVYGEGDLVASVEFTQAIAFDLGDEFLVLDKETWFGETISIKRGTSLEGLIYDDAKNWEDDPEEQPTTHYEVRTERLRL